MKSPKDVLALGRAIVQELDLPTHGATLERWLAHHLAEVLDHVDHADERDRPDLERQAVELILTLWEKRWSLPPGFGPVSGYRRTIEILDRLAPDSNPWLRSKRSDELLCDMFDVLSRCVMSGLLLALGTNSGELTPEKKNALDDSEVVLLTALERWRKHYVPAKSKLDLEFVTSRAVSASSEREVAQPTDVDASQSTGGRDASDADGLHAALVEDLERMQTRLSDLLDRCRKARPKELGIE